MPTGRRMARELALKTIFQVDVGKQPMSEVLDGALDQIRHTVKTGVAERALEAKSALLEESLPPDAEISAQSKRQLRGIAKALIGELQSLEESAAARCKEAVSESGHFDSARAITAFEADCERIRENIRIHATKPTLYTAHVDSLARIAVELIPLMKAIFEKVIGAVVASGEYAVKLVKGTLEKEEEIDRRVAELSSGWALDRQPAVDRNILRLAAYELLYVEEVPVGAVINEAVELAHKYSTEESGRFVNGVLGALASTRAAAPVLAEP